MLVKKKSVHAELLGESVNDSYRANKLGSWEIKCNFHID